ncbi:MAG: thioredoxin [Flavobacteriales bacterium]|jgi:thioredoxin 1|nr:thioredoxin [Flavobacteriales bacterium]
MALEFTKDNFETEVLKTDKVAVVDFWAVWCGPCRMVGPIIDELSTEMADVASIGKVNVDEQGDIAAEYGIRNIPTILIFKNGEIVDKQVGAASKSALEAKIKAHL